MAVKEIAVKKHVVKLSVEERERLETLIRSGRVRQQLVEEGFDSVLTPKRSPASARRASSMVLREPN